ncbi:MAG: AraC family transcriptional regulator [Rikenellaceae bacterium]
MNIKTDEIIRFDNDPQYGFKYREISVVLDVEQQKQQINTLTHNAIFFQLEGELHISWGEYRDVVIHPGELYFVPRGATVSAYVIGDQTKYIVARLDHNVGTARSFNSLFSTEARSCANKFAPLPIVEPMRLFLDSIKQYIVDGVNNAHIREIKFAEMLFILGKYYTNEERANLFYSISDRDSKFKRFILDNFQPHTNVNELVKRANMSRSTFDRKFKETFGIAPLKWMNIQARTLIVRKASEPNVTVKDLMYEAGVYNSSQFTKLCKRLCGVTPSQLIHSK